MSSCHSEYVLGFYRVLIYSLWFERLVSILTLKLRHHPKRAVSSELSLKTGWHQAERGALGVCRGFRPSSEYCISTHHNQTLSCVVPTALCQTSAFIYEVDTV